MGTLSRMDALSWRGPSSDVWVPAVLRGEGPLAEGGPRAGTLRAKQGLRPTVPSTGVATGEGVTVVSVGRKITVGRGFSHVEGAPNHRVPKPGGGGGKLTCIQRWRRGLLHLCVTAGNSRTVRIPTPNIEGPLPWGKGGGKREPRAHFRVLSAAPPALLPGFIPPSPPVTGAARRTERCKQRSVVLHVPPDGSGSAPGRGHKESVSRCRSAPESGSPSGKSRPPPSRSATAHRTATALSPP